MHQLLGYTLVFIGFLFLLLITIRNPYMPLIGCTLALFGVEAFLLTMIRHRLLQPLWIYIIGLLFVDALVLLFLWQFFSSSQNSEYDGTQKLVGGKAGPLSFLVGWLIYASSMIEKMITTKWFRLFLGLLFIFFCITSCIRSCETFPDG